MLNCKSYGEFIMGVSSDANVLLDTIGCSLTDFLPTIDIACLGLDSIFQIRYRCQSNNLKLRSEKIRKLIFKAVQEILSFGARHSVRKEVMIGLIRHNWPTFLSPFYELHSKEQLSIVLNSLYQHSKLKLSEKDVCQLIVELPFTNDDRRLNDKIQFLRKQTIKRNRLEEQEIDFKQYFLKLLNREVSPALYYFIIGNQKMFGECIRNLYSRQNSQGTLIFDKWFKDQYYLFELLDDLLSVKQNQTNAGLICKTLKILILVEKINRLQHLNNFLEEILSRLFYFCYRNNMIIVDLLLQWLQSTTIIFPWKVYKDVFFSHFLVIFQLYPTEKVSSTEVRSQILQLFNAIDKKMQDKEEKLLKKHSKDQTLTQVRQVYYLANTKLLSGIKVNKVIYNVQSISQGLGKIVQGLNFVEVLIFVKAIKYYFVEGGRVETVEEKGLILAALHKVIVKIKDSSKRCYCLGLANQIFNQINSFLHKVIVPAVRFEVEETNPLIFMYLEAKQINISQNIQNLKITESFSYYKLTTLYRIKAMEERLHEKSNPKNRKSLQLPPQDKLIQDKADAIWVYNMVNECPFKQLLSNDHIEWIRSLILTNQSKIVHSLFLHFIRWMLNRLLELRAGSRKDKAAIQNSISSTFSRMIVEISKLNSDYQTFQHVFFHGRDYCQKWEKQRQVNRSISNLYFYFMKRDKSCYFYMAEIYERMNSLRHAAYYLELDYFNNRGGSSSKWMMPAFKIYCRLKPQLSNYVKNCHLIQNENIFISTKSQNRHEIHQSYWTKLLNDYLYKTFSIKDTFRADHILLSQIIKQYKLVELHDSEEINGVYESILVCKKILYEKLAKTYPKDSVHIDLLTDQQINHLPKTQDRISIHYLKYQQEEESKQRPGQRRGHRRIMLLEELLKTGEYKLLENILDLQEGLQLQQRPETQLRIIAHFYLRMQLYERAMVVARLAKERIKNFQTNDLNRNYTLSQMSYLYAEVCTKAKRLHFGLNQLLIVINEFLTYLKDMKITLKDSHCIHNMFKLAFQEFHSWNQRNRAGFYDLFDFYAQKITEIEDQDQRVRQQKQCFNLGLQYFLEKFEFNRETQKEAQHWLKLLKPLPIFLKEKTHYVIQMISNNKLKNQFIVNMLRIVAKYYEAWSSWWISSLSNHRLISDTEKRVELVRKDIDLIIQGIGKELKDTAPSHVQNYIEWICRLAKGAFKPKEILKKVPEGLCDPFDDTKLLILDVDIQGYTGDGKSKPLMVNIGYKRTHNLEKKGRSCFILKYNATQSEDFRMEYRSSNFFQDLGIIDQEATYSIVHLSKFVLLIQKIENANTFRNILQDLTSRSIDPPNRYQPQKTKVIQNESGGRIIVHKECNFYKMVFEASSIDEWWTKFNNYARTTAQWSYAGTICGLGDRHLSNIMLDDNCKVIHIDFEYNLDKGLTLPYPQYVPFRLTELVRDPMGVLQAKGLFFCYFVEAVRDLQKNQRQFDKALCHFSKDQRSIENLQKMKQRAKMETSPTVEEAVWKLIERGQDKLLIKYMFAGWQGNI